MYESESESEDDDVAEPGSCGTTSNGSALLDLEDLGSVVKNLVSVKVLEL